MAKLKDTEINGNLAVDGDVNTSGNLEIDGYARINNNVIVKSPTVDVLRLRRTGSGNASTIGFENNNGMLGYIGMTENPDEGLLRWKSDLSGAYPILDSVNYRNYQIPSYLGYYTGDVNACTTSGFYRIASGTTNLPSGVSASGILFVIGEGNFCLQILARYDGATWLRTKWYENGFYGWKQIV